MTNISISCWFLSFTAIEPLISEYVLSKTDTHYLKLQHICYFFQSEHEHYLPNEGMCFEQTPDSHNYTENS